MKVGYLVRVRDTTHDPELPADRVGLVSRVWEGAPAGSGRSGSTFCEVRFPNGALLDFHIEFLEVLGES
jgi:hypothetical protein